MRVLAASITTLILLAACSHESENGNALRPDQLQAIDRLIETQMTANRIPGMAVSVIRNGVVVKEATRGFANVESRVPVSASTPFQLASTTKSFSSTAVLLLVGDGKLSGGHRRPLRSPLMSPRIVRFGARLKF